jgi:hypothetical protein
VNDTRDQADEAPPTTTRRRSVLPWVLGGTVVVIVVWGAFVAAQVVSMRSDVDAGIDHIEQARAGTDDLMSLVGTLQSDGNGDDEGGRDDVDAAAELNAAVADFDAAQRTASGPVMAPVRLLPVLGRQLRATTTMLETAVEVGTATSDSIDELRELAGAPAADPAARVDAVRGSEVVLAELQETLRDPDLGPTEGLMAPVADARNRFSDQLAQTTATVDSALVGLTGVGDLLEGPSTYLVLAANNAEMRAGSGMFLQAGTLRVDDGAFELSEFVPTEELFLDQPGAALDEDMAARWGGLVPNQEWRNLNLSPRFDESARMAADMWASLGRGEVDGVMAIDVVAVQRLLELTGPVEVPSPDGEVITYDAENVRQELLRRQYTQFDDRSERRDQLGEVARGVFDAFNGRPIPAADLVAMMDRTGAERHLLMWSDDPAQQDAWEELGLSGVLPEDALMLSLLNRGGTKLDPFMDLRAELDATDEGDHWRVEVVVDLTNGAPDALPRYVEGPVDGSGGVAGEYIGILALSVPASATEPTTSAPGFAVVGDDGPTRVIGANVAVPRGESRQVSIGFDLPREWDVVQVTSGARVPATRWTAGEKDWTQRRPRTVALESLS